MSVQDEGIGIVQFSNNGQDVFFFIREEPNGCLSNFWRSNQTATLPSEEVKAVAKFLRPDVVETIVNGNQITFDCNERYYQYMKAKMPEDKALILQARAPYLCMILGHGLRAKEVTNGWNDEKRKATMLTGLRMKYKQNLQLARFLISTGDAKLHENNYFGKEDAKYDPFWSWNRGEGKDMLGKCHEIVRAELRAELQTLVPRW